MPVNGIRRVAVVGSGTMGHGIGQVFAMGGFPVTLFDVSREQLDRAVRNVRRNLRDLADWGIVSADDVDPIMGRISTCSSLEQALQDVDLVVEAVFERLELKQEVFRNMDAICPPSVILASNTSSLMPSTLAAATKHPERVIVAHFFYPPPLMPLVEIVGNPAVPEDTIQVVCSALKQAGKSPIIVRKEALGFIANRLQVALLREAAYIIDQGIASAQDVDIAVKESFGRRLAHKGPIEMAEVQDGWDVIAQIDRYILPDLDRSIEPAPIILEKINRGEIGPKTGKGFYEWTPESVASWNRELTRALAGSLRADAQAPRQGH